MHKGKITAYMRTRLADAYLRKEFGWEDLQAMALKGEHQHLVDQCCHCFEEEGEAKKRATFSPKKAEGAQDQRAKQGYDKGGAGTAPKTAAPLTQKKGDEAKSKPNKQEGDAKTQKKASSEHVQCYNCKEMGHYKGECPNKKK
jgi:hypothetical protein